MEFESAQSSRPTRCPVLFPSRDSALALHQIEKESQFLETGYRSLDKFMLTADMDLFVRTVEGRTACFSSLDSNLTIMELKQMLHASRSPKAAWRPLAFTAAVPHCALPLPPAGPRRAAARARDPASWVAPTGRLCSAGQPGPASTGCQPGRHLPPPWRQVCQGGAP